MNDFDPASFQLSPEQLAAVQQQQQLKREHERKPRGKGRQSRMRKVRDKRLPGINTAFVMVPWPYILEAIVVLNSSVAVAMLLSLIFEEWQRETSIYSDFLGLDTITLPNAVLEKAGIHRSARTRGMKRLIAAGLIEVVERKPGCRARIKLLWRGKRKPHQAAA